MTFSHNPTQEPSAHEVESTLLDGSFGFFRGSGSCSRSRRRLTDIPAEHLFEVDVLGSRFPVFRVLAAFDALAGRRFSHVSYRSSKLSILLVGRCLCAFYD